MIAYIQKGVVNEVFKGLEDLIGKYELRVLISNILDCLKLEHKRTIQGRKNQGLKLVSSYSWCNN